jgi:hypothetical protein
MSTLNMHGLGEIVSYDGCLPDQMVSRFLNLPIPTQPFNGSLAADCPACCKGMAALSMDGTGLFGSGLFASPFDVSTWGAGEYLALAFGAYLLYALTSTTKTEFQRARKGVRRLRSKA